MNFFIYLHHIFEFALAYMEMNFSASKHVFKDAALHCFFKTLEKVASAFYQDINKILAEIII